MVTGRSILSGRHSLNLQSLLCLLVTFPVKISTQGPGTGDAWREIVTGPYGGPGGEWFTDWWESVDGHDYHPKRPPQQINVRAGGRVDMLQILYEGHTGARHGGTEGGQLHRLRLYNGDRVIRVTGRSGLGPGGGIDQLTFHTKNGRMLGPFGGNGGREFDSGDFSSEGCYLGYISGKAGMRLDQLFLHWRCPRDEGYYEDIIPYQEDRRHAASSSQSLAASLVLVAFTLVLVSAGSER